MAKAKDFNKIGNDAVSKFLSNTDDKQDTSNTHDEVNKHNTPNTHNDDNKHNTPNTDNKQMEQPTHNTDKETKSKRLNLLIQPSLIDDIKKVAYIEKLSVNELIIRLIKDYTEQEPQQEKIKKYNEL